MSSRGQIWRDWLVDQLLGSGWYEVAMACRTEEEIDALALELWVDFEAIEKLRERGAAELRTHSRKPATGTKAGPGANEVYPQVNINMPASVKTLWTEYAEGLHMNPTTAVRSLIHEYLLYHDEPQSGDRRWVIRGVVHDFQGENPKPKIQPSLSPGAIGVLRRRARAIGTGPHVLVRQLMVECLEGKRFIHRATSVQGMFNDPKRYFLPVPPTPISDGPKRGGDKS